MLGASSGTLRSKMLEALFHCLCIARRNAAVSLPHVYSTLPESSKVRYVTGLEWPCQTADRLECSQVISGMMNYSEWMARRRIVFKAAQYMVHDVHVECVHNTRKASIGMLPCKTTSCFCCDLLASDWTLFCFFAWLLKPHSLVV